MIHTIITTMKNVETLDFSLTKIKKIFISNIPILFLTAFIACVAYLNGINGEFISDDIPGILESTRIKNFSEAVSSYQLQSIIQSALLTTFGQNPTPFHLFSLFLHIINVCLFFIIAYTLFGKEVSAIATPLYAVHPAISEAVIWISAVNYLLLGFFTYIAIFIYLYYKSTSNLKVLIGLYIYYFVALILNTNAWFLMIPVILISIELFFFTQKFAFKKLVFLLPLVAIAVISFYTIWKGKAYSAGEAFVRIQSLQTPDASPYFNRLPYSIYMVWELLLFPINNLTLYHEGEPISPGKFRLMGVVGFITVVWLIYAFVKKRSEKSTGLVWLIFISTAYMYSPIQVAWFAADRYLYIAAGFFCVLLAMALLNLDKKLPGMNAALFITVIMVFAYGARSYARTNDWKTRKSLWHATQRVGPYGHRVYNNLGDIYALEGNWPMSIAYFFKAIELNPTYAEAMHNLGNAFYSYRRLDDAKTWYENSIKINPTIDHSYYMLGVIAYTQNDLPKAKDYFQQTLSIKPDYAPAIQGLDVLVKNGY